MAILGGAGNPVGGSFTGPAEALEVTGSSDGKHRFGYAYSGAVSTGDSETTLLEFTTGNYLFRGAFQHMYFTDSADNYRWLVYLNGASIAVAGSGSFLETGRDEVELIIPPYTEVKVTAINVSDASSNNMGAILTGRIFR